MMPGVLGMSKSNLQRVNLPRTIRLAISRYLKPLTLELERMNLERFSIQCAMPHKHNQEMEMAPCFHRGISRILPHPFKATLTSSRRFDLTTLW